MMVTRATDSPRASACLRASRTASTDGLYGLRATGYGRVRLLVDVAHLSRFRAAQEGFLEHTRAGGAGGLAGGAVNDDGGDAGGLGERQVRMARERAHHERRPDGHRGLRAAQAERLV